MIELFSILSKGGVEIWNYQFSDEDFGDCINNFIKEVLLQERGSSLQFKYGGYTIKFLLNNESNIIYLVVYQTIMKLSCVDNFLSNVSSTFDNQFYDEIRDPVTYFKNRSSNYDSFNEIFSSLLKTYFETENKKEEEIKKPKKFQESAKSQKRLDTLLKNKQPKTNAKETVKTSDTEQAYGISSDGYASSSPPASPDDELQKKREALFGRRASNRQPKSPRSEAPKKKGKQARVWDLSGKPKDAVELDRSKPSEASEPSVNEEFVESMRDQIGSLKGDLKSIQESEDEEEEVEELQNKIIKSSGGWFGMIKGLVGDRKLTLDDLNPIVDKMRENLIMKNVAAEPAEKICQSVLSKLEGKIVNNFSRVAQEVKSAVKESLIQLLTPKRRVDILRDVLEAKRESRPYVIVFCGVNGVGKSTNLAKITFWLTENRYRVLIAAGDTFRAGAVEQLRTHTRHLNALHPNSVQLYEQGYGKDSAGLAAAAIKIASERAIDVVLIDTAGRMQDNEPLMRELAKLIRINEPDLVLFVGEALVGNEAVDQLVKFNESLANHAAPGQQPRLIDGIVLTKFDTIDDKVGAAVSMTYITGQPIVFVGCGQTYTDLRNLNVGAVVQSLLS